MKLMIWLCVMIGGSIGGWIGAAMTHGNWMSAASILLSGAGSIAGVWAGYTFGKNYLG